MDDFHFCTAILSLALMTSCGGSGGGGDSGSGIEAESSPPAQVGVVIDSPIVGLGYHIGNIDDSLSLQGFTGRGGTFPLIPRADITFSIGDIRLPTVAVKKIISPLDLFSTTIVNDPEVVNFARLVQTLDSDNDPENGITISSQAHVAATGMSLDFSSGTFDTDVQTMLIESGVTGGTLIEAADALAHLNATLSNLARFAPGESYFEVYGATDGANLFSTSGHQLLGTSNSGDTFDLTGYNYAIFYIPPQPKKVLIDQLRLVDVDSAPFDEVPAAGGTWDFDVTHPDPDCTLVLENYRRKCFVETESFSGYMNSSAFFLDEFDGLTWESQVNNPAYWSGPVGGADYWVIKRSLPGEFDVNLNIENYVEPPVAGTIHISGGPPDLGVSEFKVPETKIRHPSTDALTSDFAFYPEGSLPLDFYPTPFNRFQVLYWPGFPSPLSIAIGIAYESRDILALTGASYALACTEDDCSGVDYDTVSNILSFTNVTLPGSGGPNNLPSEIVLNGSVKMQLPESVLASLREGFDVFKTFNITEEVISDNREWINGDGFTLFCGDIADYSFNGSSDITGYASQLGQVSSFERPWQFDTESETFTFLLNDALGARSGAYGSIEGIFTWGPIQTLVDADSVSNTLTMESQEVFGRFDPLTRTFDATLTVSTSVRYNPTGDTVACLYKATLRGAVL